MATLPRPTRIEVLGLLAILALAALTRLPGLDARGAFDADQGHDMLVLTGMLHGDIPLLGPPTSIGTFHHGAVYYYLLAPAVALSGPDPVAVMGWIALLGIGAVAATWWLARLIGGPGAAVAAGVLAAVSPSGIDESTFIWNPNLIPVAAALAFAGALHAWQTRSPRWWLLAATGAMVTMQCHVLGVVVLPPLAGAYLWDVRRQRHEGGAVRPLVRAGLGGLAIIAASYVPLLVHELGNDFSETRAILDYLAGGGRAASAGLLERVALVGLRSVTWPLTGLITDRPTVSIVVAVAAVTLMAIAAAGGVPHRAGVRWLLATLAWSVVALAAFAPSLAVVTPGLPNDHYHAYLDPLVIALTGAGLARLAGLGTRVGARGATLTGVDDGAQTRVRRRDRPRPGTVLAGAVVVVLVGVAVTAWPPAVSPDGGWRVARDDAHNVEVAAAGEPYVLVGLPELKSLDALRFPLRQLGADPPGPAALASQGGPRLLIIVCDPVLEPIIGAACGGAAESAWLAVHGLVAQPSGTVTPTGPRRVTSTWRVP